MALFGLKKNKDGKDKQPPVKPNGQLKSESPKIENKVAKPASETKSKSGLKNPLAYKNLIHPLITEKSNILSSFNQYVFAVNKHATKSSVKAAIKEVYGVNPLKIRIINNLGKQVRTGKNTTGYLKNWKKAIVVVPAGTKIDVYES
ncbi:MAG TPA: 50S ribosomal protein L23 [Patescibacteria group bacterium]|nr:50S ribosomal protein L23 [Patescibacteria group bacterium]